MSDGGGLKIYVNRELFFNFHLKLPVVSQALSVDPNIIIYIIWSLLYEQLVDQLLMNCS